MPEPTCYDCDHLHVCKFYEGKESKFQYKNDDAIRPYLTAITEAMAKACAHFKPMEAQS